MATNGHYIINSNDVHHIICHVLRPDPTITDDVYYISICAIPTINRNDQL